MTSSLKTPRQQQHESQP